MKKKLLPALFAFIMVITSLTTFAQRTKTKSKPWAPTEGFWMVETNLHTSARNSVYFFDENKKLIYNETVERKTIDLTNRRTLMRLKRALKTSIDAWKKTGEADADKGRVANALRIKNIRKQQVLVRQ